MTSLFEEPGAPRNTHPPLPPNLFDTALTLECSAVSLLEFFPVEDAGSFGVADPGRTASQLETQEYESVERARTVAAMLDAAREEAREQTSQMLEAQWGARLSAQAERVERVCAEFARDRQRYFAAAEGQVVKLALAVARQVLAREVAADPLHLRESVKLALSKVEHESGTLLRVSAGERDAWCELLANEGSVQVVADPRLSPGDCLLSTAIGTVEFDIETQLGEIARGFAELSPRAPDLTEPR